MKKPVILFFALCLLFPRTISAQRDTGDNPLSHLTLIFYYLHNINIARTPLDNNFAVPTSFLDYGSTIGINTRAYFSKKFSVRLGLNYMTNKVRYANRSFELDVTDNKGQAARVMSIQSDAFQIPVIIEYRLFNTSKLSGNVGAGLVNNFKHSLTLSVLQNDQVNKIEHWTSPFGKSNFELFNTSGWIYIANITYKHSERFSFIIEPTVFSPDHSGSFFGGRQYGIATNIVYRMQTNKHSHK